MLLLIEANHGQSTKRRIFISRPVETTDLDKYANKMLKNDCFIDLEGGKLRLNKLSEISRKMFASYVFPDKMKSHCVGVVCKLPSKRWPFCH